MQQLASIFTVRGDEMRICKVRIVIAYNWRARSSVADIGVEEGQGVELDSSRKREARGVTWVVVSAVTDRTFLLSPRISRTSKSLKFRRQQGLLSLPLYKEVIRLNVRYRPHPPPCLHQTPFTSCLKILRRAMSSLIRLSRRTQTLNLAATRNGYEWKKSYCES